MLSTNGVIVPPQSPSEALLRHMDDAGIRQSDLARAIHISPPRLNMILKGRLKITAEIALRLAKVLDTRPQYWLHVRDEFEIFEASKRLSTEISNLAVLTISSSRPEDQLLAA